MFLLKTVDKQIANSCGVELYCQPITGKRQRDTQKATAAAYENALAFEANEKFVDLCFPDGSVVHIDREGVEAEILQHSVDRFRLDDLAFYEPLRHVHLVLEGNMRSWIGVSWSSFPLMKNAHATFYICQLDYIYQNVILPFELNTLN